VNVPRLTGAMTPSNTPWVTLAGRLAKLVSNCETPGTIELSLCGNKLSSGTLTFMRQFDGPNFRVSPENKVILYHQHIDETTPTLIRFFCSNPYSHQRGSNFLDSGRNEYLDLSKNTHSRYGSLKSFYRICSIEGSKFSYLCR
jgi:hypothetical protein